MKEGLHPLREEVKPWRLRGGAAGGGQAIGDVPIIAEDLGIITPDVVELRKNISAPGMVVLQFAWGSGSDNVHLPHNHYENSVCYPGALPSSLPACVHNCLRACARV